MEVVKYQKKYFHLSRINSIRQIDKWCHIHTNCETKSNCHLLQHGSSCAIWSYTKMYFFFVHRDTFWCAVTETWTFLNFIPVLWAMTMEYAENSTWGIFSPVTSNTGLDVITNFSKEEIEQLTQNDIVIVCGGTNNISKNESNKGLRHVTHFVQNKKKTQMWS